jgi:hypothetical protein
VIRLAFSAGLLGAICSGVIIAAQADVSSLNWPLVLVPVFVVPLVLLRRRFVQRGAALVMALWCTLTALSLGLFFVPCTVLMFGAARRAA